MCTLNIRAERLLAGDVVFFGGATWRVLSIGKSPHPTKLDLLLEYIRVSKDDRDQDLRTTVDRDRTFQVARLV